MYTYGIDISTTCIGLGIIDNNGALVHYDNLKFNSNDKLSLEQKALMFKQFLISLFQKWYPSCINVEEAMKLFGGKSTTAHTMSILQSFNGMCRFVIYELFNIIPEQVKVKSARKQFGINQSHSISKDQIKEEVIKTVKTKFNNFEYSLTPHGNPKPGTDDMADAIVIACYQKKVEK